MENSVVNHDLGCIAASTAYKLMVDTFAVAHPNYCRRCGGWGSTPGRPAAYDDPGDDGDPCPDCTEKGKCPWCGEMAVNEEVTECSSCGWDAIYYDGIQEPPECLCWENEA
jgi:ribosomal protein L37E